MTQVRRPSRARIGLEIALIAGTLGVLTIFWRDWIEAVTGWDPDYYNGSLEWLIVAALLAASAVLVVAARRDWRSACGFFRHHRRRHHQRHRPASGGLREAPSVLPTLGRFLTGQYL